jgi:hypothetical protein
MKTKVLWPSFAAFKRASKVLLKNRFARRDPAARPAYGEFIAVRLPSPGAMKE